MPAAPAGAGCLVRLSGEFSHTTGRAALTVDTDSAVTYHTRRAQVLIQQQGMKQRCREALRHCPNTPGASQTPVPDQPRNHRRRSHRGDSQGQPWKPFTQLIVTHLSPHWPLAHSLTFVVCISLGLLKHHPRLCQSQRPRRGVSWGLAQISCPHPQSPSFTPSRGGPEFKQILL